MDSAETAVVAAAAVSIVALLWYFFGARQAAVVAESDGVQTVRIVVKGGYSPDVVVVRKGRPVRIDFYRDETDSCTDRVLFGDFGIARALPAFKTTSIELLPDKVGEFTFTCGMNMVRGKLIVQ